MKSNVCLVSWMRAQILNLYWEDNMFKQLL